MRLIWNNLRHLRTETPCFGFIQKTVNAPSIGKFLIVISRLFSAGFVSPTSCLFWMVSPRAQANSYNDKCFYGSNLDKNIGKMQISSWMDNARTIPTVECQEMLPSVNERLGYIEHGRKSHGVWKTQNNTVNSQHFVSWYDNRSIMNWSEEYANILQQKTESLTKGRKTVSYMTSEMNFHDIIIELCT